VLTQLSVTLAGESDWAVRVMTGEDPPELLCLQAARKSASVQSSARFQKIHVRRVPDGCIVDSSCFLWTQRIFLKSDPGCTYHEFTILLSAGVISEKAITFSISRGGQRGNQVYGMSSWL